jgi:hypothetical protein
MQSAGCSCGVTILSQLASVHGALPSFSHKPLHLVPVIKKSQPGIFTMYRGVSESNVTNTLMLRTS